MLTHYCASNNQPRMSADGASTDPNTLVFKYVDASNLTGTRQRVMTGLTLVFIDTNDFSETCALKASTASRDGRPSCSRE